MTYGVFYTRTALDMLKKIQEPFKEAIKNKVRGLQKDVHRQGKPLIGDLQGYRSVHAGGRYRIIFQVDRSEVKVLVVATGIRKEGDKADIYELAKKLLKLGLAS